MARFPKKEADIVALANRLSTGLKTNSTIYPQPPHSWVWLLIRAYYYRAARGKLIAAQAAAEKAVGDKDEAFSELVAAMKADIRYAENTVDFDDNKLKLVGWAGKKTATVLAPPGQVRLLEAPKQGAGWLFLDWKAPVNGGNPAAYKVERRLRDSGGWQDMATAILTEATLVEQPCKAELEYRIVAVNKAGQGEPSNTVMAVL